jgi:hypothetical protein
MNGGSEIQRAKAGKAGNQAQSGDSARFCRRISKSDSRLLETT